MASIYRATLVLSAVFPASASSTGTGRHCSTLRRVSPSRGRRESIKNGQSEVQSSLAWLTCRNNLLHIPRTRNCGIQKHDSGDVLLGQGPHSLLASLEGDEPTAEELFQSPDDVTDRYLKDLAWDPYLGEVTANEKIEEPPQYVPPPPIPAEDICIREKVEFLLYTLKRILPGQLDNDKADVLCSMLSAMVEVQNPAVCFRGSSKCSEWLEALIQMQASVNLHELYYENDMKDPDKRWVYAVWTVRFLEQLRTNPNDLIQSSSGPESTQLSGETVFEMEKSGLVSRIRSTWYILQEDDGASFTKAKDSVWRLLGRTF